MNRERVFVLAMMAYAAVLVVENSLALLAGGIALFPALLVAVGAFVLVSLSGSVRADEYDEGIRRVAGKDLWFYPLVVLFALGTAVTLLDLAGVTVLG